MADRVGDVGQITPGTAENGILLPVWLPCRSTPRARGSRATSYPRWGEDSIPPSPKG
jgi:hypothetical protein